ncbi:hypothetical protein OHT52_21030 [Streptomyces sp. NBC_00247]|uniref:hypothetical protein n=1 Tax=Streptomyces sp. NBC_00247 TaxID=2975689 RepID=UPI002E28A36B|nr:hypothetical protein [Streptomyces sp. NBC_00247]
MGSTERPVPERMADQHEQALHLTRTGNGPTVEDEQTLLAAKFGPADMAGYFTGPELDDQDDEPADTEAAAAEDGGTA